MAENNSTQTIEYNKYYVELDNDEYNKSYNVSLSGDNVSYTIDVKYHFFTKRWYLRISYTNEIGTITTSWKQIVNSLSLNFEYQDIMPYSVGCEGVIPFDPSEPDDFNDGFFKLFLVSWDDLKTELGIY